MLLKYRVIKKKTNKYQQLLALAISGKPLPKGVIKEEKKIYEELVIQYKNMIKLAEESSIKEAILEISMEID